MNSWVIPCNLKFFNVVEHLKSNATIVWKKSRGIKSGDIVYIYVGIPIKAIKYRGIVINDDVRGELLNKSEYARKDDIERDHKYMQVQIINEYNDEISLSKIKELGIYMIRRQTKVDSALQSYLNSINTKYDNTTKEK